MDLTTFLAIKDRMEELGMVTEKGVLLPRFTSIMRSMLRMRNLLGCCSKCERDGPISSLSSHLTT